MGMHINKELMFNGMPLAPKNWPSGQVVPDYHPLSDCGMHDKCLVVPMHMEKKDAPPECETTKEVLRKEKDEFIKAARWLCARGATLKEAQTALRVSDYDYHKALVFFGLAPQDADVLGIPEEVQNS